MDYAKFGERMVKFMDGAAKIGMWKMLLIIVGGIIGLVILVALGIWVFTMIHEARYKEKEENEDDLAIFGESWKRQEF